MTESNLERFKEISRRGIQDQLPPEKRARFDEAVRRGLIPAPNFPGAAVIEPALAVGSGLAATVGGGLKGIATGLDPRQPEGAAAQAVQEVQEMAFQPRTEAGQRGMENLGNAVQFIIDKFNIPASGIGGIVELVSGQGLDQAVKTIENIQTQGVAETLGSRVLEETGSPLAATAAFTAPEAIATIAGTRGVQAGTRAAQRGTRKAVSTLPAVAEKAEKAAKATFDYQTPAKQKIAGLLESGETAIEDVAGFELVRPRKVTDQTRLQKLFDIGGPKIKAIPEAQEAIRQGWDKGVIAPVQAASRADKQSMAEMVTIAERIKKDRLFGMRNRPSDVAGDLLMQRLDAVRKANSNAGKEINKEARKLRGQSVDVLDIGQRFKEELEDIGVSVSDDLELDFKGSDIEGLKGPEDAIKRVFKRMTIGSPDAYELHRLKRFIDEQVSYGKNAEGLAGRTELVLKRLRSDLDRTLDANFDEYRLANDAYSETISALDAFQDVAGKKMNLLGDNADKATGTLMRRLMGNAQSRIRLLDSLDEIEDVASRLGGFGGQKKLTGAVDPQAKRNLYLQVLFADEIDTIIGPAQRTSLQAEFDRTLKKAFETATTKQGAIDTGIDVAATAVKRAQGINEENAIKSIKNLLNRKQ